LPGKDITLHVSVTNEAVLLYQKFGFKAEEYVQGFYKKYYPDDSGVCDAQGEPMVIDSVDDELLEDKKVRHWRTSRSASIVVQHRRSTDAFLLRLRA